MDAHTDILLQDQCNELSKYTACDISDALLKLGVDGAGYLPDFVLYNHTSPSGDVHPQPPLIGFISTVLFLPKPLPSDPSSTPFLPPRTIPPGTHFADLPPSLLPLSPSLPRLLLLHTPSFPATYNALLGHLVATRLHNQGISGILVNGRIRDVSDLTQHLSEVPIYAKGTSTVGAGGGSVPWAYDVPVTFENGAVVRPGDVVYMSKEREGGGVVCIPQEVVGKVLEMLPAMVEADEKVLEEVKAGRGLGESVRKFRG